MTTPPQRSNPSLNHEQQERDEHFRASLMDNPEWRRRMSMWILKRAKGIKGVSFFLEQDKFDPTASRHISDWLCE